MWRISSLTASVDDETRILVVPLPESKRKVKVADTKYNAKTYTELYNLIMSAEEQLSPETDGSAKRFDDKTEEELEEEMARKRKQQFGKLTRFRYYQFTGLLGVMFFYLFVYRQFMVPSPVMNSITYNHAV